MLKKGHRITEPRRLVEQMVEQEEFVEWLREATHNPRLYLELMAPDILAKWATYYDVGMTAYQAREGMQQWLNGPQLLVSRISSKTEQNSLTRPRKKSGGRNRT
jgi:hypothetical protein